MLIFGIILICIGTICLTFSTYFALRNNKVYKFRHAIICKIFDHLEGIDDLTEYLEKRNKVVPLINKYSYDQMLFSRKKLELEEWFTKEEIYLMDNVLKAMGYD